MPVVTSFQDEEGRPQYLSAVTQLRLPERNTLLVNFSHLEDYSTRLATLVQQQYYQSVPASTACASVSLHCQLPHLLSLSLPFFLAVCSLTCAQQSATLPVITTLCSLQKSFMWPLRACQPDTSEKEREGGKEGGRERGNKGGRERGRKGGRDGEGRKERGREGRWKKREREGEQE